MSNNATIPMVYKLLENVAFEKRLGLVLMVLYKNQTSKPAAMKASN